ncbi:unnamed protein product [Durusdinium trenchii]|uniref:Uncharacterized protein n=1 Tax=Durusdinium trenchii TaxID=1381693 RepID=A0ABP0SZ17_9DINO
MVFLTVSAGYTCAALLAGAATAAELGGRGGRSVLDFLGLGRRLSLLRSAERTFHCQLWSGCAWRPCVVGMSGDLLMLSSRLVEEARLMENAKVSVQDGTYASVALDHCDPLQLCFTSAEEALSFASEVAERAQMKRDMWKLADQAKELRECLSSTTFSSDRSAPAPKAAPEAQAALRARLAVPKGVPMYTLSPCASGHDLHDEVREFIPGPRAVPVPKTSSCESSTKSLPRPHIPKLQIQRANSCPSPGRGKLALPPPAPHNDSAHRLRKYRSEGEEETPVSPSDPNSFASKVFMGLGLHAAKASLVAEKRVDVLKTKFESSKRSSGCSSSPAI